MTHHDLLIDAITDVLYKSFVNGQNGEPWDYSVYKKNSQKILELVEEFQDKRSKLVKTNQWRASD